MRFKIGDTVSFRYGVLTFTGTVVNVEVTADGEGHYRVRVQLPGRKPFFIMQYDRELE